MEPVYWVKVDGDGVLVLNTQTQQAQMRLIYREVTQILILVRLYSKTIRWREGPLAVG